MTAFDKRKIHHASKDDDPLSKLAVKHTCRLYRDFILTYPCPETTDSYFWKKNVIYRRYEDTYKYENSFSMMAWQSK